MAREACTAVFGLSPLRYRGRMGLRWVSLVVAAASSMAARAADVTTLPPPSGTGIERGVAVVRCSSPTEGVFWNSVAAVLDAGASPTADVLLTTAHGLPADAATVKQKCRVLVRGKPQRITDVRRGGGQLTEAHDDWSVIVTKRISGPVLRWRPVRVTDEWLADAIGRSTPVRLVLRYAGTAQTDCNLEPEASGWRGLVAHSCMTHPGTSGAPLVIAVATEPDPVLIGFHVGSELRWLGMKLDFVGVARRLDAEITAAIEAAALRTTEPADQRRDRRGALR
jgi:hypothetical protein